jgi:diaminohydroxyphosphoribosylaminopyrimidine deaminase / 5-amino-6-(5-phosphoribosylamino)uracil reductase
MARRYPCLLDRAEVTRKPLRITVDSNVHTPASARVLDDAAPTVIGVADNADPHG